MEQTSARAWGRERPSGSNPLRPRLDRLTQKQNSFASRTAGSATIPLLCIIHRFLVCFYKVVDSLASIETPFKRPWRYLCAVQSAGPSRHSHRMGDLHDTTDRQLPRDITPEPRLIPASSQP